MWSLIRVSLQLVVSRSSDGSRALYKEIMVFIMAHVLDSVQAQQLAPDTIYTMMAKIDRRLRKLSGAGPVVLPTSVLAAIHQILHKSSESLTNTWALSQKLDARDLQLSKLSALDFERDTLVALPTLDAHIEDTQTRQRQSIGSPFTPSSHLIEHESGSLPSLPDSNFNDSYAVANLCQFEEWVARHINDWVGANKRDNACKEIRDLLVQYHRLASVRYSGNPETTSVMVLTSFELWVACDKAALRKCPWFSEYDPGIPTDALQNLLLPFLGQMKRLLDLEDYIGRRQIRGRHTTDSLFACGKNTSFASQYFDRSDTHQALLSKINSEAKIARNAKLDELKHVKAEYHRLDTLLHGADHEYTTKIIDSRCDPPETKQVHNSNCKKCSYESQRDRLSINVHEWPLPSDPSQAKAVVFELDIPSWFANWRDARLVLLQSVLEGKRPKVRPSTKYLLSRDDPHLRRRHSKLWSHHRIDLLSPSRYSVHTTGTRPPRSRRSRNLKFAFLTVCSTSTTTLKTTST